MNLTLTHQNALELSRMLVESLNYPVYGTTCEEFDEVIVSAWEGSLQIVEKESRCNELRSTADIIVDEFMGQHIIIFECFKYPLKMSRRYIYIPDQGLKKVVLDYIRDKLSK